MAPAWTLLSLLELPLQLVVLHNGFTLIKPGPPSPDGGYGVRRVTYGAITANYTFRLAGGFIPGTYSGVNGHIIWIIPTGNYLSDRVKDTSDALQQIRSASPPCLK